MGIVNFSPKQEGTGDPSPTNIRPIHPGLTIDGIGDIYGGYVDFENGELVNDMTLVTFDGSSDEQWKSEYLGSTQTYNFYIPSAYVIPKSRTTAQYSEDSVTNASKVGCNQSRPRKWTSSGTEAYGAGIFYLAASGTININGGLFEITTLADFKSYLTEHPLQVAYELATPTTYSLTASQLTQAYNQLVPVSPVMLARRRRMMLTSELLIPPQYQLYDYVQSNSMNARIDTGVSGADNTLVIICTFMPIELVNSYAGVFGNYKNENDYYCWRVILSANTSTYFNAQLYICCGNNSAGGGGTNALHPTFNDTSMVNKKFTVRMSYGTATITGEKEETKTTRYAEKLTNETTIAVGSSRPAAGGGSSKFRFYAFKMWSQGKLIRDYRPCVRKSDNKAGFYDMVNHTFNPSIGTADFIAGND